MNKMNNPEFEVIMFDCSDIVTTSGGFSFTSFFGGEWLYFEDGKLYDDKGGTQLDYRNNGADLSGSDFSAHFNNNAPRVDGELQTGYYSFNDGVWSYSENK